MVADDVLWCPRTRATILKKKELEKVAACILQNHLLKVFSWI